MKILVFVKQVPDVNKVSFDIATGRIIRENVPLSMNSFDRRAVEEAIRLKEKHGFTVEVVSMGPPQAIDVINESLRMGADEGFLITDRKYGGADTWATAYILSYFAKQRKPDLMIGGKYSLDGETSQVPPEISKMCEYRFFSSISKIEVQENGVFLEQDYEHGILKIKSSFPMMISVSEKINRARKIDDSVPDMKERVQIIDSGKLGLDFNGNSGSLTIVDGTEMLQSKRVPKNITLDEAVDMLESALKNKGKKDSREEIRLETDFSGGTVMGIALLDSTVSIEIASEVSKLSRTNKFLTVMAGNVSPDKLKGMPANHYYHIDSTDPFSLSMEIGKLIDQLKPEFVIFPSNSTGRDVVAFIAAEKKLGLTADCVDIKYENGKLVQFKPAFGGGIIARILSKTKPGMATVRPGMFKQAFSREEFQIHSIKTESSGLYETVSDERIEEKYLPLNSADIVIGLGRGVKSRSLVESFVGFSRKYGIGMGGTRPVVDMHLLPRQQQIGITGMAISPELYIAVGVSGMDNHMSGLRYAGKIVSINNDPSSPINRLADYTINATAEDFMKILEKRFVS
ncbi:MAG: FAD-binding protein [Candidatus Thermoplasmatota archaeon]|jgi:electron transfer flavoprotein alpha subunit|nr:FAD-binding protein [Candidatus Thermoplasmatota archaeon]